MSATLSEGTGPVNSAYAGSVPVGAKLIYSFGGASETIINLAFNSFNFFFYTAVLGLSATLAGLAITIALVCDAITDPLIGSWSDRFRSRFGRRHLFMFAAPLPVMASLFFIYSPPALGEVGLFLWLTLFTITLRATMTLFHIPHLALGAELSADFTERTRIMSMNTLFGSSDHSVPRLSATPISLRQPLSSKTDCCSVVTIRFSLQRRLWSVVPSCFCPRYSRGT